MPAQRGNFVRTAEWRSAREFAVTAPQRTEPAALAITGEAGAGKSNLWRAAVAEAAGRGCRVLRSEPSASEADTPFAGLSDLLAGVVSLVESGIPQPQREALDVALLARPAGEQPPPAHAIGRGVLAALNALVSAGPVLLAVDDVQWLDTGSMDALVFALRRIAGAPSAGPADGRPALSLLLAARTEAPADPLTVGTPSPPDGWRRLLAAFPPAAAAELVLEPLALDQVQGLLPATATIAQARLVTAQSRGNPFWAREIWSSIATTTAPAEVSPAGEAPVPPRARAALAGRLKRSLSPPAAEALAVVAAAGRITVPDALAAMEDVADSAAAIDSAVEAGVVIETEGRLAPAHPLIGATAVEAVPPDRQAALYRRLAAVSASPERRAQFTALAAAAQGTMPDQAVADALDAAAEAAAAKAAYAAAAKFAAQSVRFTPPGDEAELIRRRIRAGELFDMANELTEALEQFDAVDLNALTTTDAERVLPRLADLLDVLHGEAAARSLITRSLESATGDRPRAVLQSLAADIWYGVPGQRRAAAAEAIAHAEAAGPEANASLHRALVNLVGAKCGECEGVDEALLTRAEQLERIVPGIPLYEVADGFRNLCYRYTEQLDIARAAALRLVSRARDAGDDWALSLYLSQFALTEELAGDYQAAKAALDDSNGIAAAYDWPEHPALFEPQCELLIANGNLDEARRIADEHLPDEPDQPIRSRFMGASLRGKASAWAGDAATAVRYLELAARYADELGWLDPGQRSRVDCLLAEAHVATGQPAKAAEVSARLRGLGARMNRPTLVGDACRIDALAAAAAGDQPDHLDAAAEHARAAVAAHERSQLRTELAHSLLVLGQIERRRKARTESRAALRRAHDLAVALGHEPLLAQINAELPTSALSRAESVLTAAEQRVAEQIAKGSTNREAAAELFLSVRTVETHVASIYRKLGVRTRSDLRRTLGARTVETPLPVED
ncbi:MAG TPA: LuxR family transcriptional regulator [Trebonia sp.]|jgi:DNA-binding NarL/FixJ family response regulator|nr:LuxR family transcriptional regulator [Trebonia sp.]